MGVFDPDRDIQATIKTILETVRNFAVVVAIGYASGAMNSIGMKALYFVTLQAFIANMGFNLSVFNPFYKHAAIYWNEKRYIMLAIVFLIATIPVIVFNIYVTKVIDEAILFQGSQHRHALARPITCNFGLDATGLQCIR